MSRSLILVFFVVLLAACSSPSGGAPIVTKSKSPMSEKTLVPPVAEAQVLDQRSVFLATLPPPNRPAAMEATAWNRCAQKAANPLLDSPLIEQDGERFILSVCFYGQAEDYMSFHVYINDGVTEKAFRMNGMNAQWLIENDRYTAIKATAAVGIGNSSARFSRLMPGKTRFVGRSSSPSRRVKSFLR